MAFWLSLYLAVATQARAVGFFSITLAGTLGLAFFTRLPLDTLVLAFVLALPACLESLRSAAARQVHGMRFASCLVAAYIAMFAYGIILWIAEAVTGLHQYQLRLANDYNVVTAAVGVLYYALRAGLEVLIQVLGKPAKPCSQ